MGEDLEVDNIYEAPKRDILKACVKCQPTLTRQMLHISDDICFYIIKNMPKFTAEISICKKENNVHSCWYVQ